VPKRWTSRNREKLSLSITARRGTFSRMKICYFTLGFMPAIKLGGPVQVMYHLTTRLARRGHEVTVVCTNLASKNEKLFPDTRRLDLDGVKVIYFNTHKLLPLGLHSFGLTISPGMFRFCRQELMNFDVIHTDGYRDLPSALACHFGSKYGIPVVIQPRGTLPVAVSSFAVKRAFDLLLGRRMLHQCAFLIAVSTQEKLGFHGIVPAEKKVVRIFTGIDSEEFKDLPEKGNFRRRYGISEPCLITYLGRLHAQKGIDVLIRAAAMTRCRPQSRLAIIGPDDGFGSRLVALTRELGLQHSVTFVPPLAGREKLEAYVDSDVVVYASQSESFGLVPFEATMCGVPSISSENSPCAEILGPLGVGFQVPYGDFRKLAATIDKILENRAQVIPRVQAAAVKLQEILSWEEIARQYEDTYLMAVELNRPTRVALQVIQD